MKLVTAKEVLDAHLGMHGETSYQRSIAAMEVFANIKIHEFIMLNTFDPEKVSLPKTKRKGKRK